MARVIAYGTMITDLSYRGRKNVEPVIVHGYRRVKRPTEVFPVALNDKFSSFWAIAYEVDDNALQYIDIIEGHPHLYQRTRVKVERETGDIVDGWMYVPSPAMMFRFKFKRNDDAEDRWIDEIKKSDAIVDFPVLGERIPCKHPCTA